MPLVWTPRQLANRSDLYHQLSSMTAAGLGLIAALETVKGAGTFRSFHRPLQLILRYLAEGASLSEAMRVCGSWAPAFDIALVQAGETSGRLDVCFRYLSEYYSERAKLALQLLADFAYPVFLLHFAILIFPTTLIGRLVWQGEVWEFVRNKLGALLPLYAIVFFVIYAQQGKHGESWRAVVERILQMVPVLSTARMNLALARLSLALESLINAGVSIIDAWELAAAASGSPSLGRTVLAWRPQVLAGETPADVVRGSHAFPELFANLYHTGEISGQLDDTLRRLFRYYQEEGLRKAKAFSQWAPRLIYLMVVMLIARQIVTFWSNYFSQLNGISL